MKERRCNQQLSKPLAGVAQKWEIGLSEELSVIVNEAKRNNVNVAAHAQSSDGIELAIKAGAKSIEHGDGFNDDLIQLALDHDVFWVPTISIHEHFKSPALESIYETLNKAYRKGVKIALGSDVGGFPWTINQSKELEYYVNKAEFEPMDAIKSGTSLPAELLGRQEDLGRIQKGFIADIIAVMGNPLEDITLLQKVDFVMKNGKIYNQPDRP